MFMHMYGDKITKYIEDNKWRIVQFFLWDEDFRLSGNVFTSAIVEK